MRILPFLTACLLATSIRGISIIPADEYDEKNSIDKKDELACGICICLEVDRGQSVDQAAWQHLVTLTKNLATTLEDRKTGYLEQGERLCDEISLNRKPINAQARLSCSLLDGIECAQCKETKRVQFTASAQQVSASLAILRTDVTVAVWLKLAESVKALAARRSNVSYQEAKRELFDIIKLAHAEQ